MLLVLVVEDQCRVMAREVAQLTLEQCVGLTWLGCGSGSGLGFGCVLACHEGCYWGSRAGVFETVAGFVQAWDEKRKGNC